MQHLAIIMDGNRRWAKENKLEAVTLGHKKGAEVVEKTIEFCIKKGIRHLSLYAFSIENFKRSEHEKKYLFNLLIDTIRRRVDEFIKNGVKVRFVGDRDMFPGTVAEYVIEAEEKTKDSDKLTLNILFCYGAKQELIYAARQVAQRVKDGDLLAEDIDENVLRKEMWMNGAPDPDLIVRTGGTTRLSNFLLFQGAYSEWLFLDCAWPEVTEQILGECVEKFYSLKRNFGT